MADLTACGYQAGDTALHQMDVRFKLASMVLCSLATVKAPMAGLGLMTMALVLILVFIRLPLIRLMRELRYFSLLLFIVFVARSLSTPGTPLFQWSFLVVTRQGIHDGALICWRLVAIVLMGLIFVATTRPSALKAAVEWWLGPIPFIPAQRVAVMISLVLRFTPVIWEQARETGEAQKARGIENIKNPFYRLKKLALPLFMRIFITADELALAMDARCYTETRTGSALHAKRNDWLILGLVILLCGAMLLLN